MNKYLIATALILGTVANPIMCLSDMLKEEEENLNKEIREARMRESLKKVNVPRLALQLQDTAEKTVVATAIATAAGCIVGPALVVKGYSMTTALAVAGGIPIATAFVALLGPTVLLVPAIPMIAVCIAKTCQT